MKIKIVILAVVIASFASSTARAEDEYVNGYERRDGTYVEPYHRTAPDGNPYNNYSSPGNENPYNGRVGGERPTSGSVRDPYQSGLTSGSAYDLTGGRRR